MLRVRLDRLTASTAALAISRHSTDHSAAEPALTAFAEAADRVLDDLASAVVERRAPAPLPPLAAASPEDLPGPVLRVRLDRLTRQLKTLHDAIERWSTRRD